MLVIINKQTLMLFIHFGRADAMSKVINSWLRCRNGSHFSFLLLLYMIFVLYCTENSLVFE